MFSLLLVLLFTVLSSGGCRRLETISVNQNELAFEVGDPPVQSNVADSTSAKAQAVTGVSLSLTDVTLFKGGHPKEITAMVEPVDAGNKDIVWESSNPAVARVVIDHGLSFVIPSDIGEAVIRVRSGDGDFTATCKVRVCDQPFVPQISISASYEDRWYALSRELLVVERKGEGLEFYDISSSQGKLLYEINASVASRVVHSDWGQYAIAELKFSSPREYEDGLHIIDYRSQELHKIAPFSNMSAAFSPTSDLVAFYSSYKAGTTVAVAKVSADGSLEVLHQHDFPGTSLIKVGFVNHALLGIALEHRFDDWSSTWELYTWHLDSQRIVKHNQFQAQVMGIAISPDSKSWALWSMVPSKWAIWQPQNSWLSSWVPLENTPTGVMWSRDSKSLLLLTAPPSGPVVFIPYNIDPLVSPAKQPSSDVYSKGWLFVGSYDYYLRDYLLEPYLSQIANAKWKDAINYVIEFHQWVTVTPDMRKLLYYDAQAGKISVVFMDAGL